MSQETLVCGLWYKVTKSLFMQYCYTAVKRHWACGLRYSVCKSMFINKMLLYSSKEHEDALC